MSLVRIYSPLLLFCRKIDAYIYAHTYGNDCEFREDLYPGVYIDRMILSVCAGERERERERERESEREKKREREIAREGERER